MRKNISNVIIDDLLRMYWGDLMITRKIKESDNVKKWIEVISEYVDLFIKINFLYEINYNYELR